MSDVLLCVIAVIVSLVADSAIDIHFLNSAGLFGEDFKSLRQFAQKNKNLKNYENVFEALTNRIEQLEALTSGRTDVSREVTALKKEVAELRKIALSASDEETNENTKRLLKQMAEHISALENERTAYQDTIQNLNSRIAELEQAHPTAQDSPDMRRYESQIQSLHQQVSVIPDMEQKISALSREIEQLQKSQSQAQPVPIPEPAPPEKIFLNKGGFQNSTEKKISPEEQTLQNFLKSLTPVVPDENYVRRLKQNLAFLNNRLGIMEYENCENTLDELLEDGDFDDAEEIMSTVHHMIEKYIYGSDSKVSAENWNYLEAYLRQAGYLPVPVKPGDAVSPYKVWFERQIPASGGAPGTFKQIQLMPYAISYQDGGETEVLKLFGKCTYYR